MKTSPFQWWVLLCGLFWVLPEGAFASFDGNETVPSAEFPSEVTTSDTFWELDADFILPIFQQIPTGESLKVGEGFESTLRTHMGVRGFFLQSEFSFVPAKAIGTVEALQLGDVVALAPDTFFGFSAGRFLLLSPATFETLLGSGGFLKTHSVDGAAFFLDVSRFRLWGAVSSALPIGNEFFNSPGFTNIQQGNGAGAFGINFNAETVSAGIAAGHEPRPFGSFLSQSLKPKRKVLQNALTVLEADTKVEIFSDFRLGVFHQHQWDHNATSFVQPPVESPAPPSVDGAPVEDDPKKDIFLFEKTIQRSGFGVSWMVWSGYPTVTLAWVGSIARDVSNVSTLESSTDLTIGAGPFSVSAGALHEKASKARYIRAVDDSNSYYNQAVYKVELRVQIKESSVK